jgi:hypothetical protein
MKSNNNNNDNDDDDNNAAMGSVHARGDTFLTFGLKTLTETNTSHLVTGVNVLVYGSLKLRSLLCAACLPPYLIILIPLESVMLS